MAEHIPPNLPPPSLMPRRFMARDWTVPLMVKEESRPFRERWFFFYGPMTNPDLLKLVLNRSETPELFHAVVFGHEILYRRHLPVAVQKGMENAVGGFVCKIESQDELSRLEAYMTSVLRIDRCTAWLDDYSEVPGFVFIWDGDMSLLSESPE